MNESRRGLLALIPMMLLSSAHGLAQAAGVTQLSVAEGRFAIPFSEVGGIRELPDKRVLVLDLGETGVVVLDPGLVEAKPVGRRGSGPAEYLRPTKLLSMPNGGAAILDWGNTRLLSVDANAAPGGFLPANAQCSGISAQYPLFLATDRDGRFYSEGALPRRPGFAADSTAIVRWRTNCAADTVVMFQANPIPRVNVAFRAFTQWVVSDAGTIAIVQPNPYRVTLVTTNGQRREGPTLRYEPVRVTEAIKARWREEQQLPMGVVTVDKNGSVSGGVMKKPYREPEDWPDVLPPFLGGALLFDAEGHLWIRRTVGDRQNPQYDVVDEHGRLSARIELRGKSRVVGFGDGVVYIVQRDDDDLEFLERYSLRLR